MTAILDATAKLATSPSDAPPIATAPDDAAALDLRATEPAQPLDWRAASTVAAGMCFVFGLLESGSNYLFARLGPKPLGWMTVLRGTMPWWLLWMAFMPLVLWLARRYRFDDAAWRRSALVHTAAAVVLSLAHGTAFGVSYHYLNLSDVGAGASVLGQVRLFLSRYLFTDILTYSSAVAAYYAFEYFAHSRRSAVAAARSEARAARLQLSLAEARIHALRVELNPHFLFSALNAVAGLVRRREHDAAVEMLARVGDLLRTTLDRQMPPEIPFTEELALVRRFLDIELVRFGDRLRVAWDIEPDTSAALVPPLILQPLVENALRHGISRRPGPALLRISARLDELYGPDMTSLELSDVAGGGARARLLLPFHLSRGRSDVARGA